MSLESSGIFKQLPGGLYTAVVPMKNDPVHWSVLGQALSAAVEYEARAHNAYFDYSAFGNIIDAINSNDLQAWFLVAAWKTCSPKIIGAAVEFPTVLTRWDGQEFKHSHAIYQEDTALPIGMLKALAHERPIGKFFPQNIGLGEYFEKERIRLRLEQDADMPVGRVGEYAPFNTKMINIMEQCGVRTGRGQDGSVLELKGPIPEGLDRWKVPVSVESLYTNRNNPNALPYVFLVGWSSPDDRQKIVASFTKGISTFTGETIIRTQVTSNGNLPDNDALKHIMASILSAGQDEAVNRGWGAPKYQREISPIMSIHGEPKEALAGLMTSNKVELFIPRIPRMPLFGGDAPIMRIHALGEPKILAALSDELPKRILGIHTMQATDQYFEGTSKAARPLCTALLPNFVNIPCFDLGVAA